MARERTEQELFWAGDFGDAYIERNIGSQLIAANVSLFSRIIARTRRIGSVLELGANVGLNLEALRLLLPEARMTAVEINAKAYADLRNKPWLEAHLSAIADFDDQQVHDLVFTKGVLIHVDPAQRPCIYDVMYRASSRYLCVAEYYSPSPVSVPYRGHSDRLFKADFASELIERFPDLKVIDYGFVWRRDHNFAQDDLTWFLLEKNVELSNE